MLSSWKIIGMSDYEMQCEMEKDNPKMMNKAMSVDDTLEQRGSVYGEFGVQLKTVGDIVKTMAEAYVSNKAINPNNASMGDKVPMELLAEWHYLAIKLARIAVNPDHTDSYHDLAGYATLMERERMK